MREAAVLEQTRGSAQAFYLVFLFVVSSRALLPARLKTDRGTRDIGLTVTRHECERRKHA